jgi:class 3 adenylate cyclase
MLNDYYALMFEAITSNGGSVNQMIGDGLMAIFGAPVPYEDHCARAVNAAMEMLDLLEAFNRDRAAQDKPQIKIGIGIASGMVIAGFTGTQHRAPILASAIRSISPRGSKRRQKSWAGRF